MDTPVTLGQVITIAAFVLALLGNLAGLVVVYVKVVERLTSVETDMKHVLRALGASRRADDGDGGIHAVHS